MSGTKCPLCQAENEPGARFCGGCGKPLEAVSTMAGGVAPGKTMLMQTAPPVPAAKPPQPAPQPPKGPREAGPARTMLGMSMSPDALQPPAGPREAGPGKTMLGMRSPPPTPPTPGAPTTASTAPLSPVGKTVNAPPAASPAPSPMPATMRQPPAAEPSAPLPHVEPSASYVAVDDDEPALPGRKGPSVVVLMVLGASLILGLAAAAIWVFVIRAEAPPADVVVTRSPDGEAAILDVRLTPFLPGTKVRIGLREVEAQNGVARITIPLAELSVGENALVATISVPGAPPEDRPVRMFLSYRARADLTGLGATPPRYDVVFDLPPGARVETPAGAVPAGPDGRASVPIPVDGIEASLDPEGHHRFDFRVVGADGAVEAGSLVTVVPLTRLTIDRPGAEAVTESAEIECAGVTEEGATVQVQGAPVAPTAGRFSSKVPLPAVGPHEIRIRAAAPGKAPKNVTMTVRRVTSLRAEMQAFEREVDPALTWTEASTHAAQNRGKRVSYVGKIFNLRTEEGVTAIQALVQGCPRGERCSLWVVYRGMTDAQNGDWVKILGMLDGEQTYVTSRGEQLTVPRVEARFVVKTRAP